MLGDCSPGPLHGEVTGRRRSAASGIVCHIVIPHRPFEEGTTAEAFRAPTGRASRRGPRLLREQVNGVPVEAIPVVG